MASDASRQWRPKAKTEGLVVEEAGSELIAYNLKRHRVHCLNDEAVKIWRLCTGRRTIEEIAAKFESALEPAPRATVIRHTVDQFERLGLVEPSESAGPKMSRRELVRKIGIGALAAGVVLPLVTSIVAPTPAYAQSCIKCVNDNAACCGPHPRCNVLGHCSNT